MSTPAAMEGDGHYNAHSSSQAEAGRVAQALLSEAAGRMPLPASGTATIVDYGAAQGRNSLAPVNVAIDAARARHGDDLPVCVVHADLPGNDFGSLFDTVAHHPGSYLRPGVFVLAAGRSFYEQILPPGSVSLGWSSIALHWLSRTPGPLDGFWYASGSVEQRRSWARRAAQDWHAFLLAREAELAPGGLLVLVVGAAGPDGGSGAEGVMGLLDRELRALVDTGSLSAQEYAGMAVPAWYRTADEWRAPFPVGGLTLERLDTVVLGDTFWAAYAATGDAARYAEAVSASLRVSFGPSLLSGLPAERRAAVATELFDLRLAAAIAAAPEAASCAWQLSVMVVVKGLDVPPGRS